MFFKPTAEAFAAGVVGIGGGEKRCGAVAHFAFGVAVVVEPNPVFAKEAHLVARVLGATSNPAVHEQHLFGGIVADVLVLLGGLGAFGVKFGGHPFVGFEDVNPGVGGFNSAKHPGALLAVAGEGVLDEAHGVALGDVLLRDRHGLIGTEGINDDHIITVGQDGIETGADLRFLVIGQDIN